MLNHSKDEEKMANTFLRLNRQYELLQTEKRTLAWASCR